MFNAKDALRFERPVNGTITFEMMSAELVSMCNEIEPFSRKFLTNMWMETAEREACE